MIAAEVLIKWIIRKDFHALS